MLPNPFRHILLAAVLGAASLGVHAYPVAGIVSNPCEASASVYTDVWPCYRERLSHQPVNYRKLQVSQMGDVEKRSYDMISQQWPESAGAVSPNWTHQVDIYVPKAARSERALLVINNGTNHEGDEAKQSISPPTDFDENTLLELARKSRMIVVSLAFAPNQYLMMKGDTRKRKEDNLIAFTWRRFLDDRHANSTLPLHVPMAEAAVRAMDLAQKELSDWDLHSYVVTGLSKRAWATWLTAIGDPRVVAVVPFVIGMRIQPLIKHIQQSYGGSWPIALRDYFNEGILERYLQPEFDDLMGVEDPYAYLSTQYGQRLRIPKYIVNASGDDFFPPDVSKLYINDLPGETSQRVVPNSDHYGIKQHVRETLLPVLERWNAGRQLPSVQSTWHTGADLELSASSSEAPQSARLWIADNPAGRDFRYACGIRYHEVPVTIDHGKVLAKVGKPSSGWLAAFAELKYPDGLVATTPVYIYPETYPSLPPQSHGPACSTLPQRSVAVNH